MLIRYIENFNIRNKVNLDEIKYMFNVNYHKSYDEIVKYIEQNPSSIYDIGYGNNTALMIICKQIYNQKLFQLAQLLIENGININYKNNNGQTALHLATIYENFNMVTLLIDNNVNAFIVDNNKMMPIFTSINRSYSITKLLLEYMDDPNVTCNGYSLLYKAIDLNRVDVLKLLLTNLSIDIYYNNNGIFAIDYVILKNASGYIINLFLDAGHDPTQINALGNNLFYYAEKFGNHYIELKKLKKKHIGTH